jgi:hypothetical protein
MSNWDGFRASIETCVFAIWLIIAVIAILIAG